MPQRIQRKRTKGWKMPENAVYVGRPTKWGNPFKIGTDSLDLPFVVAKRMSGFEDTPHLTREMSVQAFEVYLNHHSKGIELAERAAKELRGKDLACWCPLDQPCHADILLRLANKGE